MALMVAKVCSNSSTQLSSPILAQEKGSRNKRKFRADLPLGDPYKFLSTSQQELASFEFSDENFDIIPSHGQLSGCEMCNVNQDHSNVQESDLGYPSTAGSSKLIGPSRIGEENEIDEFNDTDWGDLNEGQLEELVLHNLDTIFRSAIKKIVASGYNEEAAMKAVLRSGFCYGCKDTVSDIVDNTLGYLRKVPGNIDLSKEPCFEDLQQLEKHILGELVGLLREVRPFFSVGDAMWCLLISDMNLSHACAMEGDLLNSFIGTETSSVTTNSQLHVGSNNSEVNLLNSPKLNPTTPCVQNRQTEIPSTTTVPDSTTVTKPKNPHPNVKVLGEENSIFIGDNANKSFSAAGTSQRLTQEEKFGSSRKNRSIAKRESILRQKSFRFEKHYRTHGSKGGSRPAKLSGLGAVILDKKPKSVSDSISIGLKSASVKISQKMGVAVPLETENQNLLTDAGSSSPAPFNTESVTTTAPVPKISIPSPFPEANTTLALPPPSLSAADTELSLSLHAKVSSASQLVSPSPETPNCSCPGMPCDKSLGAWVLQGKKDEMILKVVPRVQELQNQLQEWTEWANQKVMQAARRLGKEKAELKTLRQEKEEVEHLKKEKQTLKESTMKKLSEMENALCKASGQVERANSAVQRLELENATLGKEMYVAKVRAVESDANCKEVSKREKSTRKKFQSWEKQKTFLQEEISANKRILNQLLEKLQQSKELYNQVEAKGKQEEKAKEELLKEAASLRKEKERSDASGKSKVGMLKLEAENNFQGWKSEIQRLEKEISQLRLKADSSKIAALRRGINGSYPSRLTATRKSSDQEEHLATNVSEVVMDMYEYSGKGSVKRERECVMCLSEEMSVVFLPCAHQVVCANCNELHQKQGMKDCPSCRSPIQHRISVIYACP